VLWKFLGYPDPRRLINERELRPCYRQALKYLQKKIGKENIGDYFEFGVCHGTSLLIMYDELLHARLANVRLFGFDSFAGLPPDNEGMWKTGWYSADYDDVVQSLNNHPVDWTRVQLVKGFFSETLTGKLIAQHNIRKASIIMIDCDMYSSAKESLDFCGSLILDEAVIIFDDWNPLAQQNRGEKRAFEEFLQENPDIKAVEIGSYSYNPGDMHGKVFRVSRMRA